MLKKRILTASILLPVVILSILLLPVKVFAAFSGSIFLLAMWEWTSLAGFTSLIGRIVCFVLMPFIALGFLSVLPVFGKEVLEKGFFVSVVLFWLIALSALYRYPKHMSFWKSRLVGVVTGCLVLLPAWALLVALQYQDPKWVLYVLSLIWLSDTAAYFVGKRYGKRKLASTLSPGKTWEGALGAFVFALPVIMVAFQLLKPDLSMIRWVLLSFVTVAFSIIGDLFESLFKRLRHLKDSGTLLPGHGGILDRIDSLTAALPIFAIGFMFFN